MSAGIMPTSPTSISKGFTSTPVKYSKGNDPLKSLGDCVISDEEDTYSLLSPIYHDSFDSDEDLEDESLPTPALSADTSFRHSEEPKPSSSPDRHRAVLTSELELCLTEWGMCCELPKTRIEQPVAAAVEPIASHTLSAWEMWLVNKAKDERMKLERKAEEERLLMEKKLQQERDQVQKKMMVEERIEEWLKMKREQERQQKMLKRTKEQEELRRQKAKQSETEQKAQTKYREWLRNKNQEKIEKEKREKEEAIRKQEQELERRRKAEESFQEWVAGATEKSRASPQSPCFPKSPYDKSYPLPSFFNPVPWKPIHTPLPETQLKNTSQKNPGRHPKHQQSSRDAVRRINNSAVAARLLQWR